MGGAAPDLAFCATFGRCYHHRRGSGVAHAPTNPREYHAILLSKRGDIAAHVSLSDGHELHWRAFVFEAATKGAATRYDSPARSLPIALYMGQS